MGTKQTILRLLSRYDGVVSGERLSADLGISRVAVWKHIQGLIRTGIPIESSPKGYCLTLDADNLQPYNFEGRQERIHFFQETGSTMDEAAQLARAGCPNFTIVVAQHQTKGRGRMQRSWVSKEGGLYFTMVLRPDIPLMLSGLVNLAAAVDMADVLSARYGLDAGVKWPNDILVDGRKICGILSQMEAEGDQIVYLNVGMGINVNNHPEKDEPRAVSVSTLLHRHVPRREILVDFLDAFEKRMTMWDSGEVVAAWKARNVTLDRQVRIQTLTETVAGTAVDLDGQGGLVLQLDDGTRQTVIHGDCFLVG